MSNNLLKIAIAADHGGFNVKEQVKKWLLEQGYQVTDFGTDSEKSCDYPPLAQAVAKQVQEKKAAFGVLSCGTGLGMSYAANRYHDIRAALCWSIAVAKLARQHNNANILILPSDRVDTLDDRLEILSAFLNTPFSNEDRHINRIKLVESGGCCN